MKNTKFTFYFTSLEYGDFNKTVFQTVLKGQPFEDKMDAREWFEDHTDIIFTKFDLATVFEHTVIDFHETTDDVSDIEILSVHKGRLDFEQVVVKNNVEAEVSSQLHATLNAATILRDSISDLDGKLGSDSVKNVQTAIEGINKQVATFLKDFEVAAEKKKKPKKEYPSVWIDPAGTSYRVGFAMHNEWAARWLRENAPEYKHDGYGYWYEELESRGWARILGWTDPPSFSLPERLGPKITRAIKDYCQGQGVKYPDRINTY